jgi:hypothetical protein
MLFLSLIFFIKKKHDTFFFNKKIINFPRFQKKEKKRVHWGFQGGMKLNLAANLVLN